MQVSLICSTQNTGFYSRWPAHLALFLWVPNRNAGRSREGRNRPQIFSVTCVTGGKESSVFCEGCAAFLLL